jgi:hypothetical protein
MTLRKESAWVDDETGIRYVFNGGHTVNLFDDEGNNFDVFTFGDFSSEHESEGAAYDAIVRHIASDAAHSPA